MGKSIFIVTSGEYSDYSIRAVFLNKKQAMAFADSMRKGEYEYYADSVRIEEWEDGGSRRYKIWCARSKPQSVEVEDVGGKDSVETPNVVVKVDYYNECKRLEVDVEAPDEKHAIKIAADKFRQFVAENSPWVTHE